MMNQKDRALLNVLYSLTSGQPWEPPNPRFGFFDRAIEAGYLRRLDGRCGFEAFRDSHIGWTEAGLAAVQAQSVGEAFRGALTEQDEPNMQNIPIRTPEGDAIRVTLS